MSKCDCGYVFAEHNIMSIDMAGADYYPYEGEIYTFVCENCGCLTEIKESDLL